MMEGQDLDVVLENTEITSSPEAISLSTKWEPRKPAPPVTKFLYLLGSVIDWNVNEGYFDINIL